MSSVLALLTISLILIFISKFFHLLSVLIALEFSFLFSFFLLVLIFSSMLFIPYSLFLMFLVVVGFESVLLLCVYVSLIFFHGKDNFMIMTFLKL